MKKTILLSSILAVGAAFADPASVTSANAIGALDVTITKASNQTLIAVPFLGYDTDGKVAVKDMVKTSNLAENSKLYVPDGTGAYNTWTLNASGEWVADQKVTIINNGAPSVGESANQADAKVNRGDSFWLEPIFKESATSGTIYLLGQGAETVGTSEAAVKWNLMGNASVNPVGLGTTGFEDGETIVVQVEGKLRYYTFKSTKGGWRYTKSDGKWSVPETEPLTIAPGQGFWYNAKSAKTIDWANGTASAKTN